MFRFFYRWAERLYSKKVDAAGLAIFRIWGKYMDTPTGWEYNFLRNQMTKPWNDAGTVQWSNKQFSTELVNIEEIR